MVHTAPSLLLPFLLSLMPFASFCSDINPGYLVPVTQAMVDEFLGIDNP